MLSTGDVAKTLIPPHDLEGDLGYQRGKQFRTLLDQDNFRKMARKLLAAKGSEVSVEILRGMAGKKTDEYISGFVECGLADHSEMSIWLRPEIVSRADNIGHTLECYVAEICQMDLGVPSAWNVMLDDASVGDYDVLAWFDPHLMYIECKSSHPDQIDEDELRTFLYRRYELAPDITAMLVDSDNHGALKAFAKRFSNLVHSAAWQTHSTYAFTAQAFQPVGSVTSATWYGSPGVYIVGTKDPIIKGIRQCLAHYHRAVKGRQRVDESLDYVDWLKTE
jgi:hypothetical protein